MITAVGLAHARQSARDRDSRLHPKQAFHAGNSCRRRDNEITVIIRCRFDDRVVFGSVDLHIRTAQAGIACRDTQGSDDASVGFTICRFFDF